MATIEFFSISNKGTKKLSADPLQKYYAALYAVGPAPDMRENDGIKRCPICGTKTRFAGPIECPQCR